MKNLLLLDKIITNLTLFVVKVKERSLFFKLSNTQLFNRQTNKILNYNKINRDRSMIQSIQQSVADKNPDNNYNKNDNFSELQKSISPGVVGVFFHYRDVKVALEELTEVGFSLAKVCLVARKIKDRNWNRELHTCDRFDASLLNFSENIRSLLLRYFNRNKYLVLVSSTEGSNDTVKKILSRRQGHSKVWILQ